MMQEIRIFAELILEAPAELSKKQLFDKFEGSHVLLSGEPGDLSSVYTSRLNIINIKEEAEIYENK